MATNPLEERVILEAKKEEIKRFLKNLNRIAYDFPSLAQNHLTCMRELEVACEQQERLIGYELLKLGQIIGSK